MGLKNFDLLAAKDMKKNCTENRQVDSKLAYLKKNRRADIFIPKNS